MVECSHRRYSVTFCPGCRGLNRVATGAAFSEFCCSSLIVLGWCVPARHRLQCPMQPHQLRFEIWWRTTHLTLRYYSSSTNLQLRNPLKPVNHIHIAERRRPRPNVNLCANSPELLPLCWGRSHRLVPTLDITRPVGEHVSETITLPFKGIRAIWWPSLEAVL